MMFMRKTKHGATNYKALKPFIETVRENGGHYHFKADGFMDLVMEDLEWSDRDGNRIFSISHYGEQNGDLMADPDMTFALDEKNGRVIPRSFRNDYLCIMQEVFTEINGRLMYSERLLIDLDRFLWQWLNNIRAQGFKAA